MAWYDHLLFWRTKRRRKLRRLRGRKLVLQKEARAISLFAAILESLPPESRERVLAWLGSAYALGAVEPLKPAKVPEPVKPEPPTPASLPAASAASVLVKAVTPEAKPPESKVTYRQRRRKTARKKL